MTDCMGRINNYQPREDYFEYQLFFWAANFNDHGKTISASSAFHHARWMVKVIYCLKIFFYCNKL